MQNNISFSKAYPQLIVVSGTEGHDMTLKYIYLAISLILFLLNFDEFISDKDIHITG